MSELDPREYRQVIGRFATGVTVVTSLNVKGEPEGMTANSITSVSLDPVLLLVCFERSSRTAQAVTESRRFVVNILGEGQEELSFHFAKRPGDQFGGIEYELSDGGIPILSGGIGHLECTVHFIYDGGDHIVVVGEVQKCRATEGKPLLFWRGDYRKLR
jgi:flavin reductase (DIM6/NTAB) family NADH-FMN oxidoreductase RutF